MHLYQCRSESRVERLCRGELHSQGEPQYVDIKHMRVARFLTDHIATLNATDTTCGAPVRDGTKPSIVIPAVGLCVLLFVFLRMYTRLVVTKLEVGLDDWATILLAVSFYILVEASI